MKSIFVIFTVLTLLAAGCTRAPSSPTTAPPSAQESATSSSPEVESTSPSVTPEKKPEIEFVWTVETGIRLEDATVPNIYRLEDGRIRMYYGGPGGILSAISDDGMTFTKETGVRVPSGNPGSSEAIVSDPTLVTLKDGRVRMYYKGATGSGGPGQSVHSVFSAISTDGLRFEKEGVRIDSQKTPDRGWASVPEAIVLPDGRIRIYYVSDGLDVEHGVVSAISEDGLNFTREVTKLTGFVDPAVVRLVDGNFLMLAVAFPFGPEGKLTDAAPGIYSFISEDGINFEHRQVVLSGEHNIDPAIIDMGDGAYRVYYWNATENPPAIKSIAGRLK